MNHIENLKNDQSKPWVWVLFQARLEKIRKIEEQNVPRAAKNEIERKASEALQALNEGGKFTVKDKYKGSMLCAYLNSLGKLTPTSWKTVISMVWPAYESEVGRKPEA